MRLALNYQRVDPSKGGAETYVVDLCRSLVKLGHEVDLYAQTWREDLLPAEVRKVAVPVSGRTKGARLWSFAENSAAALERAGHDCSVGFINVWGVDVLIPQGGVHGASLEANSKRFPRGWRRRLYLLGKSLDPKRGLYRRIEARQYDLDRTSRYVAVSRMVQGHLAKFHGVPADRVHVVPNAIDGGRLAVDDSSTVRGDFRRELGLSPDDLVGLFVGHNYWLKGLQPLLNALRTRLDRDPKSRPIHLLACGGGNVGPFRRIVNRLGLKDHVRLLGFQNDIRPPFHASDFFVSPTYYDPCSLVVFEALACGLPVITSRCNGAGELISQGAEGFVIVRPDAVDELADALDRMTDDQERLEMSEKARALGHEQSFDRHVARLLEVFQAAADAKSGRPARRSNSCAAA